MEESGLSGTVSIEGCGRCIEHTRALAHRSQGTSYNKGNSALIQASKTELSTGLSLKANSTDVSKTVEELSRALEERPAYQEISSMLRDYASRADLVELLASQSEKQEDRAVEERESI